MRNTSMMDKEYEIERRERMQRWARRRRKEKLNKVMIIAISFMLILFFSLTLHSITSNAKAEKGQKFKYYTSVRIESGDSLWTIANQYMDSTIYSSKQSFINELKSINHIEEDNKIVIGQVLIVPYYSVDYIAN